MLPPPSPAASTLDAVASPTAMTAITAPAAYVAEALEPCERALLSVLRLWPRGAAEAAVADRAGLDATTAAAALRRLGDAGLVISSEETPPARRQHERIVFWRLAGASTTAALMAHLPLPDPAQRRGPQGPVPDEFWHHFCSGSDPADLRLPRDATLVGCRLIESFDSEARSWVLSHFTVEQLTACHSRYPDPSSEAPRLIAAAIEALTSLAAYKDDDRPHIAKVALAGVPVTVRRDLRGFVEGRATQLASPSVVDGIAVGSAPDLMATKLEVIQHRRQGRDYIDIAAMDRAGACTIEDGLRYHKQRYAPTVTYEETLRIAQLATSAPPTDPDPALDHHLAEAADHLAARRRAVLDWALQSGQRPRPPHPDPPAHEF